MNRRTVIALAASSVAVVTVVALLWAFHSVGAAPAGRSLPAPLAPLLAAINYQGQLTDPSTGNPVPDGVYSMTFRLYDVPSAMISLWSWIHPVTVTNGLFNVRLPVNPTDFTGQGRWLGVQVGADPEMEPRQPLLPVPYALSLRPGGLVSDALSYPIYAFYNAGTGDGVLGVASSAGGGGVMGLNETTGGFGVVGVNNTAGGVGVQGVSDLGVGGAFTSAHNIGLFATGGARAILADGDVHIDGNLTWYTRTGYVSVSPAAFESYDESYQYVKKGRSLYSTSGEHYYAPLQLPHGATVTTMTFYYRDANIFGGVITMTLKRGPVDGTASDHEDMAQVRSVTDIIGDGYGSGSDDSIANPVVDNENYIYWLYAHFDDLLSEYLRVMAVVIEYQYTEPY